MNRLGRVRAWWVLLATMGPLSVARAQESPPAPSLEDLVARAMSRSPSLQALQSRYLAALRAVQPAGALPDPMVEVGYRQEGRPWDPMRPGSMAEVSITQALPFPGKRRARREEALASAGVIEAETRAWQQRVIARIRATYAHIHALDREREVLHAVSELLDLVGATTTGRHVAGQADQEALVKVQVERLRLRERETEIEAAREVLVASLLALTDDPADVPFGPTTPLPEVSLPEGDLEEAAIASSGLVAVGRARLQAARRHLEASRMEARPNFLVGLGAGSTLMPEAVLTVRFGVEVPVWASQKQVPRIEQALMEMQSAEADLRQQEATVRSELRAAQARFRRAEALRTVYREGIEPEVSLALQAALAAYRAGTGDFSTVIEDFRGLLEARAALARLEADRFEAWAAVQALVTPIRTLEEVPQ